MANVTIYENIYADKANYITVQKALERIKTGGTQNKTRDKILEIRDCIDKEKADALKRGLPSVCFSGEFKERKDKHIIKHSGYIVLDFDNVAEIDTKAAELTTKTFIYAMWLSPRGNGLKCLIRIANGEKHREHFAALKEIFPDVDSSGVNEARVCYESYDPNIYINEAAEVFKKTTVHEKYEATKAVEDEEIVFKNLLTWQSNKGGAFRSGERNIFFFKLAGACCRYGLSEHSTNNFLLAQYPCSNDFTQKEAELTIKSAYRANASKFGTAQFERDILVDKSTRREIEVKVENIDLDAPPRDIIYGAHVKENALSLYRNGYAKISGIGVPKVDYLFKKKKGEVTGTSGIGNTGKSTWQKWTMLMRILLYKEKYVAFVPEDNPPEEYYHDFVEMLLGCNCTPYMFNGDKNFDQPSIDVYNNAYDFVSSHIFYLCPSGPSASLDYILERFLEMVIKEKISGVLIDPWNQVEHDYNGQGANVSKYLEYQLGRISKFSQQNDIFFDIIMHPKSMSKLPNGNYDCPDKFDMNDGAMWANKLDNLLMYHRPFAQTDPQNPICEFHSKKIKRQKTVGKLGFTIANYILRTRRFSVDDVDHMQNVINKNKLDFRFAITDYQPVSDEPVSNNPSAGITKQPDFGGSKMFVPSGFQDMKSKSANDVDWNSPL